MVFELFLNAVVAGVLLGGFYAAVALGLSIVFGRLDIVNIAHPAFVIVGSYVAFIINERYMIDPILSGLIALPFFFLLGIGMYRVYYVCFERTGQESLTGLAFFFGVMFIIEVLLILYYGVDYRNVQAPYIGKTLFLGFLGLPYRMLVPFVTAALLTGLVYLYLSKTFLGRAILAVSQDRLALQLMGADPVKVKQWAFGIGIATAAVAGALLIVIQPVEPSVGRLYIGRVFAIVILGGMGSISGTFFAALIIGIAESLVATFIGPSWAPAVAFALLLLTLAVRPQGLFGRA
ncbi:MAG: branched-chain amino acid ABC transporter permease [Gammaproteobacteria bacterium]|nr:branched-chain amino acid ABC transporter permease [Gammaproteobacteria bacterium]